MSRAKNIFSAHTHEIRTPKYTRGYPKLALTDTAFWEITTRIYIELGQISKCVRRGALPFESEIHCSQTALLGHLKMVVPDSEQRTMYRPTATSYTTLA